MHGERGYQIVLENANTPELQQRCLQFVRWGAEMRYSYTRSLYDTYVAPDLERRDRRPTAPRPKYPRPACRPSSRPPAAPRDHARFPSPLPPGRDPHDRRHRIASGARRPKKSSPAAASRSRSRHAPSPSSSSTDEVFAVDDTCIHQERSLSKGTLLDGQVICPGHQWKFDPRTGTRSQDGRQATYAVQVTEEGAIFVPTRHPPGARRVPRPPGGEPGMTEPTFVVVGAGHAAAAPPARCAVAASPAARPGRRRAVPAPTSGRTCPRSAWPARTTVVAALLPAWWRQRRHPRHRHPGDRVIAATRRRCSRRDGTSSPTSSCSPPAAARRAARGRGRPGAHLARWPTATGCASGCRAGAGSAPRRRLPRQRDRGRGDHVAPRCRFLTATRFRSPARWAPTSAPPRRLHARHGVDLRPGQRIARSVPTADGSSPRDGAPHRDGRRRGLHRHRDRTPRSPRLRAGRRQRRRGRRAGPDLDAERLRRRRRRRPRPPALRPGAGRARRRRPAAGRGHRGHGCRARPPPTTPTGSGPTSTRSTCRASGHATGDDLAVRGNVADLDGTAFWLRDGLVGGASHRARRGPLGRPRADRPPRGDRNARRRGHGAGGPRGRRRGRRRRA